MLVPKGKTVLLLGITAAGKSTLAKALSASFGFVVFPEVGGELRKQARCPVAEPCPIFDELVMLREFKMDRSRYAALRKNKTILLGQWHMGNMAYSMIRAPGFAAEYVSRVKNTEIVERFNPEVFLLDYDPSQIAARCSYSSLDATDRDRIFFTKWRRALEDTMQTLHLTPIVIDASQSPERVLADASLHFRDNQRNE